MTKRRRVRFPHIAALLVTLAFLAATPAYPSGFQLMNQDARAMGMGLAFTAVADDPAAIFYNPAGLGFQKHFGVVFGGSLLTRTQGDFDGANPYPGVGDSEHLRKSSYFLPTLYVTAPLTPDISFGLGIFAPYGLGYRWEDPNSVTGRPFTGRFISQYSYIQTADINPVISFQATPAVAFAVGVDYRLSKVQLERNLCAGPPGCTVPFPVALDIAHVKLNSDLTSNHGWGWNAGVMIRPVPQLSLGVAYRSHIKVDYSGDATFQQILTGIPPLDAGVAATLPPGTQTVNTSIDFPSSLNLGAAVMLTGGLTISGEADWTEWTRFKALNITFPALPGGTTCAPLGIAVCRMTVWDDSWAYRIGLEKKFAIFAVRAGYYHDNTPQPVADAGPLLADSNRNGYTLGFGIGTDRWGVDISDLYLKFKDRDTRSSSNDGFFGVYKEAANVVALRLHLAF
ncbi:MAG TPA: outer membrane protein transport protein [Thermoanaerobaculia bacterium]|nr:outer membrane protein transport protein [Thermoanaerobaculia bacterium]